MNLEPLKELNIFISYLRTNKIISVGVSNRIKINLLHYWNLSKTQSSINSEQYFNNKILLYYYILLYYISPESMEIKKKSVCYFRNKMVTIDDFNYDLYETKEKINKEKIKNKITKNEFSNYEFPNKFLELVKIFIHT